METKSKRREDIAQNDIIKHQVFKLPASKGWQALIVPEDVKKWWGAVGVSCPSSTMEARKGGKYLNCMRGPDGKEYWSTGVVNEFIPDKKLVITDSFSESKR